MRFRIRLDNAGGVFALILSIWAGFSGAWWGFILAVLAVVFIVLRIRRLRQLSQEQEAEDAAKAAEEVHPRTE